MNKLVLTDEAIDVELAKQEKQEGVPERYRYPRPHPDLPYYKAISLATVKKAKPLIRQDVVEYISKNIMVGGFFSDPQCDITRWLKFKAKVEKEG